MQKPSTLEEALVIIQRLEWEAELRENEMDILISREKSIKAILNV